MVSRTTPRPHVRPASYLLCADQGHATRGFKALKQIVKLQYQLGHTEEMLAAYKCDSTIAFPRARFHAAFQHKA